MKIYLVSAVLAFVVLQATAQRFFGRPGPQQFQRQNNNFQPQFQQQQNSQRQNNNFQPQPQFQPQNNNFNNNFDFNTNNNLNNNNFNNNNNNFNKNNAFTSNNNNFNQNQNFNNNNNNFNSPAPPQQTQTQAQYEFGLDTSDGRYVKFDGPVRGIPEGHGGGKYGAADCLLC